MSTPLRSASRSPWVRICQRTSTSDEPRYPAGSVLYGLIIVLFAMMMMMMMIIIVGHNGETGISLDALTR